MTLERRLGREPGPRSARPQACRERFLHVRGKPKPKTGKPQTASTPKSWPNLNTKLRLAQRKRPAKGDLDERKGNASAHLPPRLSTLMEPSQSPSWLLDNVAA